MALPATPERWPRRLARAGWRAVVVGAALGGLTYASADAPSALGVAVALAGIVGCVDMAERSARSRAPDPSRDLRLAAAVWSAAACAVMAGSAQAAFAAARAGGAPLEAAWGDAWEVGMTRLGGWPVGVPVVALASGVAPAVLLARLSALPGVAAVVVAGALGFGIGWLDRAGLGASLTISVFAMFLAVVVGLVALALLNALDQLEARVIARASRGKRS